MHRRANEINDTATHGDIPPERSPSPRLDLVELRKAAHQGGYRVGPLASYVGVSERQLHRVFARELGCSPEKWLREARLQTARQLLRSLGTVKEVALALSYNQVSQFSRDFRQRFGCSPSQWMVTPEGGTRERAK